MRAQYISKVSPKLTWPGGTRSGGGHARPNREENWIAARCLWNSTTRLVLQNRLHARHRRVRDRVFTAGVRRRCGEPHNPWLGAAIVPSFTLFVEKVRKSRSRSLVAVPP